MIAIVTETLCCMSEADCAAYGVFLVSLDCRVGARTLADRIITAEEPVADGEGCSVPPSEADYAARFEELLQTHDGVLCITASRKFSYSNRNAALAAASFGGRVAVIDSGSVAGGLFLLVLRARHMVTLGYPMSRIKVELESYKNSLKVSFTTASVQVLRDANERRRPPSCRFWRTRGAAVPVLPTWWCITPTAPVRWSTCSFACERSTPPLRSMSAPLPCPFK